MSRYYRLTDEELMLGDSMSFFPRSHSEGAATERFKPLCVVSKVYDLNWNAQ